MNELKEKQINSRELRFKMHPILFNKTPVQRRRVYAYVHRTTKVAMSNIKAQVYMKKTDTRRPNFNVILAFATCLNITVDELINK